VALPNEYPTANILTATARDLAGNSATSWINVNRDHRPDGLHHLTYQRLLDEEHLDRRHGHASDAGGMTGLSVNGQVCTLISGTTLNGTFSCPRFH